jgi:hypothetical protein
MLMNVKLFMPISTCFSLFSERSLGLVGEADASTHLLQSKALGLIGYTPTSFEAVRKWINLFLLEGVQMSLQFRISPAFFVYYCSQLSVEVFGLGKSKHIGWL